MKKFMAEQQLLRILNAAYSPNFNGVEGVIGLAKAMIKKERWNALQQGQELDIRQLIEDVFVKIDKIKI